ncbi:hypothetical protein VTJ83DRAFT_3585 [Remersonia thermophila]|uniref:CCHC-type domain-containing protein n=1 Tax=Remersonia thermophila TaxID=72144 RepID=A0ABR4DGP9_9PEZI
MDPESCGCIRMGDGRLYSPVLCDACAGSMRMGCYRCGGTGSLLYPCPHQQSLRSQSPLSSRTHSRSSSRRITASNGSGLSPVHHERLSLERSEDRVGYQGCLG